MDGRGFDDLARRVATAGAGTGSRRRFLRLLAGGSVAALLRRGRDPQAVAAASPPLGPCRSTGDCLAASELVYTECKDRAGDLEGSIKGVILLRCLSARSGQRLNCQRDGCFEGVCTNGICCPEGSANCNGQCIDTVCPPGGKVYDPVTCTCQCPAPSYACRSGGGDTCFELDCDETEAPNIDLCMCVCRIGLTRCGDDCVDLLTAKANCGACGTVCPGAQSCRNGVCGCPADPCPDGSTRDPATCACSCGGASCAATCCNGRCTDVRTDKANCGSCAITCPGVCCGGRCTDTQTDGANCGGCGVMCGAGEHCQRGRCACDLKTPDRCNGVCTDFGSDPFACGGCGGIFACSTGLPHCCPGLAAPRTGICTDVTFDGANCGRCGNACTGGKTCQRGQCQCPLGTTECGGRCVAAMAGKQACLECGDGETACGDACCGADETCDAGACVARRCGVCETEMGGQCYAVVCDPGLVCVNDACVSDPGGGTGGGSDPTLGCPPDWLDCETYCCPPGNYYCGGGQCCFDPALPCFPPVPRMVPASP